MRIQRLDITGFKSFTDRSVFSFSEGITGIVGPNGCGKSNVVDAVRWVMGEQSAKNLRGRGMEDVIFSGSETKPALSMAEVSLTLRIEDGDPLAPQYSGLSELTVTRRLFRSGESEYLINKTPCRLLDITELFLGTGVGTRAYSIVEQGRVGLIVSAKAEDRRAFIEEAAGVTKYKARRKTAERKLEYTQQNLLRVTDIVSELEKRLDSLARQAKKADKYKKIKAQLREIELHAASHRFLELHGRAKVLQEKLEVLGTEERSSYEEVRKLEGAIESDRRALETEEEALQVLQQDCHALESQVQVADERLNHWRQDAQQAQQGLEHGQKEQRLLAARRAELEDAIRTRESKEQTDELERKEVEVSAQVAEEDLRRLTHLETELLPRQAREQAILVQIASGLANQESDLANLGRRRDELHTQQSTIDSERDGLRADELVLEKARHQLAQCIADRRLAATQLAERRGAEEMDLDQAREEFAESEVKVIWLREELADKRARLSSLEQIQRNYEGFDRGVRAVMLEAGTGSGKSGVYGVVADVVSAPARLERAIEAALGERLQGVIVEDRDRAIELIEHLKSTADGRSTFLPMRAADGLNPPLPDLSHPGVIALAADQVSCDEVFAPLVRSLLEGVLIVADLAAARDYADKHPPGFTLVTLEGEVLRPDGAITGGALEGPAIGALQKKREIAELFSDIAAAETEYNEFLTRHYALQKRMLQSESVLKGLAQTQHAEEIGLATEEKDLQKTAGDLSRIRQQLAAAEQRMAAVEEALGGLLASEEDARGQLAQLQLERAGREETLQQLGRELEALKRRSEKASDQLTGLRVKAAANAERAQAARKELGQLRDQVSEVTARLERLECGILEASKKAEDVAGWIRATTAERNDHGARLRTLQEGLADKRRAHAEFAARIRADEARLRELRARLDELTQGLSQLSIDERELAIELEYLIDQVRERHQLELSHELHRFHLEALPSGHEARLKELRAQVERLGEINLTAIDEHAEVASRCDFLCKQQKDLEHSLLQLRQAIARIDRTSRERFEKTFELVNEKFQLIFPRLFGGGRAALMLTESEASGEPGVEIVAQPPGKKLQSVNLLSGGEKALTAVSLVFAIFLIKPTPFCMLDEVDAPLDEANVGRYNDLVREISKRCQFILITHNKRTMEVLDTLYGVTMEEPGVSKLVSVKMRDAIAANENQAA
jgi:chromosome segregation protein